MFRGIKSVKTNIIRYFILLLVILPAFFGCEKALIEPNKGSSPEKNFEVFWNDINNTYPFFSYDHVNWQEIYDKYRPSVNSSTTEDELFEVFKNMLRPLLDGHISLEKPDGETWANERHYIYSSNFNFNLVKKIYLKNKLTYVTAPDYTDAGKTDTILRYGFINGDILYFNVETFLTNLPIRDTLRNLVKANSGIKGIIMNMRNNGGGLLSAAQKLAGYITGTTQVYGYLKYKTGPLDNNFSDPYALYTQRDPQGSFGNKPVTILTNRFDFSATEHFVMATKDLANVTTIGDTTGGAFSPIIERTLPDGIQYTVVGSITTDKFNKVYEKIGLSPEIYKQLTTTDFLAGKDPLVDAAIKKIEE